MSLAPAFEVTAGPYPSRADVAPERFAILRDRIVRTVMMSSGAHGDDLLDQVVTAALDAFVETGGDVRRAAAHVAPLLEAIGERQAHRGWTHESLAGAFQVATTAAQKGLVQAVGDLMTRDLLMRLREDLMAYLLRLYRCTRTGFDRTHRLLSMSREELRTGLAAMAFGGDAAAGIETMAPLAGWSIDERVIAVVSIDGELSAALRGHARVISHTSPAEVLVPEAWAASGMLNRYLTDQAVAGPPTRLVAAAGAVTLARRAAELLRTGVISDDRRLVPCSDLLGDLIVGGNQLLADLLVEKHLPALEAMPRGRRMDLGTILLHSLERGLPTNQLARALGLPAQTAHSRMQTLRTIYGAALDDPTQRLELIVALRAALPRW